MNVEIEVTKDPETGDELTDKMGEEQQAVRISVI